MFEKKHVEKKKKWVLFNLGIKFSLFDVSSLSWILNPFVFVLVEWVQIEFLHEAANFTQ